MSCKPYLEGPSLDDHTLPRMPPRMQPWQAEWCRDHRAVHEMLDTYGSPLHVHHTVPLLDNASILSTTAAELGLDLDIFFARKANKALIYVQAALGAGLGVDIASQEELLQARALGAAGPRLVITAAVKSAALLRLAVECGATVVLDNDCERQALLAVVRHLGRPANMALRLSGFRTADGALRSRFGYDVETAERVVEGLAPALESGELRLEGLHFHLDGYRTDDRLAALDHCLALADRLASQGHGLSFIDMGGGVPVSYVEDAAPWNAFQLQLERALLGQRPPITYRNYGYGRIAHRGEVLGPFNAYPHHQPLDAGSWMRQILEAQRPSNPQETVAAALRQRGLRLCIEPGRFLLDGCGLTVARVAHRKQLPTGEVLLGLEMNSSNCRSRKSELLTDPVLVSAQPRPPVRPTEVFLTGSYCSEDDLITHRRVRFANGVQVGDAIVFLNTAGYLMHFTESRSHQFPLPHNLVFDPAAAGPKQDLVDFE